MYFGQVAHWELYGDGMQNVDVIELTPFQTIYSASGILVDRRLVCRLKTISEP